MCPFIYLHQCVKAVARSPGPLQARIAGRRRLGLSIRRTARVLSEPLTKLTWLAGLKDGSSSSSLARTMGPASSYL